MKMTHFVLPLCPIQITTKSDINKQKSYQ